MAGDFGKSTRTNDQVATSAATIYRQLIATSKTSKPKITAVLFTSLASVAVLLTSRIFSCHYALTRLFFRTLFVYGNIANNATFFGFACLAFNGLYFLRFSQTHLRVVAAASCDATIRCLLAGAAVAVVTIIIASFVPRSE